MASTASDVSITREQLTKYFHLPITDVAKELGICATMLKKICRKNGIPRWPHRKIKSLNKMIESLENSLPNDGSEAGECIRQEIVILKNKKSLIMRNPSILVQGSNKRSVGDSDDQPTPKKQRSEEAPVTTFTSPKSFTQSTPTSFSINQLLTAPTSFSTPLTASATEDKDYRSPFHPSPSAHLHSLAPAGNAPFPDYKEPRNGSFSSPLTSYLPNTEEEEHARHVEVMHPPTSHPSDPYYYHKAALAYQYQYHRQFPMQHSYQGSPYVQQQGSPRNPYLPYHNPAMVQQQVPQELSQQPQQQQQATQQPQQPQQQPQQQAQQPAQLPQQQTPQQKTPSQQKHTPPSQKQVDAHFLPKINVPPTGLQETSPSFPIKFRPPSPSLHQQAPFSSDYYYHFQSSAASPRPPQQPQ